MLQQVTPTQTAADAAAAPHAAGAGGFLPHGYCYLWDRPLLATHVVSDVIIGLSYVVIAAALVTLVHRSRREIPFSAIFVAFGLFIVACGMTHFMDVLTLWHPVYWTAGGVKVVTAVASAATAAVMPSTLPRVLTTIRDARLARERELATARADALEEHNALLQEQALELELQSNAARSLAEELEAANDQLRAAVRQADDARRIAEDANRTKSEFLAVMSHELRTPLNVIGGYTELLDMGLRGPVTPEQREDFARIRRSQHHLLGVITDVLNFARLEAGQVEYRVEAVPLGEAARDVVALVEPQIRAKGVALVTDGCDDGAVALADRERVRQVLLNLLTNAAKFTDCGGRIVVSCSAPADDGPVAVHVADTGRGIAADQLERIFEPFVQVDASFTRTQDGVGLGLAISRDLARGMGGDLTVESTPGRGSTFTLTLPRQR